MFMESFFRAMRRVYANYLGVTPPPPEKERLYFGILVVGVLGLLGIMCLLVFTVLASFYR